MQLARFLLQLAATLLVSLCCSEALITVGVSTDPAYMAVDYGADSAEITCTFKVMPEVVEHPSGSLVTFASAPDRVRLILRNHYLDADILKRDVPFQDTMNLTFQIRNVRESGRFSCDISALPETPSRPAREFVLVYVRINDTCNVIQDLFQNRECIDDESVCKPGFHLKEDRLTCIPISSPKYCSPVSVCKQCSCKRKEKRVAAVPYIELSESQVGDFANAVSAFGGLSGVLETLEICYLCANDKGASKFMTALIVTFLVLLSGAMTIIGTAVFYDWCKRRHDLNELEREHTEVNPDAVEVEALRWVAEDRPPSYVDSRKSDLHLAGIPPPLYEDLYRNDQDITQNITISSPRLESTRGSVPFLEPIHEQRRLSI